MPAAPVSTFRESKVPRHIVCLTFDFDTQSGFIARGMTTPTPLSRGEFGLTGAQRILALLKSRGMRRRGSSPASPSKAIREHARRWSRTATRLRTTAGPMSRPQSRHAPRRKPTSRAPTTAIARLTGRKARGYRSPAWDLSDSTIELLIAHGFLYDLSLMGADYWPYRARRGDVAELGKPFVFGAETTLVEMPISWSLDDFPHFEFMRTAAAVLPGLHSARAVMQNWLDEFLYMRKTVDWGVLTYTMHPYVIGRGYRMLSFEDLVDKLAAEGAVFMTMEDAAREARERMFAPPSS